MSPPVPDKNIDWSSLGLGLELPNRGHVEARFHLSTGKWTAPELVANPNISISGMSPGLNYGQQCYEGLKAFRTADGHISVFRPAFHAARLQRSAEAVSLPAPSQALFLASVERAVAANAHLVPPADTDAYLYIRPVLFGASAQLALAAPEESVLAVYVHPIRPYHGTAAIDGLVLEDFDRAAPRGVGGVKVGGNYAPVWRHAARAKELGYGITLHLDSATRTFVEEFSTSGFLGHRTDASGRSVLVVPQTENAIASATSDSMVRVAEREGWIVEKKELPFSSLSDLDEVVAVGTAAAAVPIRTISRLSTNEKFTFNSAGGELLRLSSIISGIQRGTQEDTEQWGHPITKF
ncbi:Putative aminotransferase class IV, branched-chain amino acid aminotransferase II [Colletotrichum destructivum]|uniref:Aminotransferase class IV, branched-chain amino acid aminotransferase II n=1 Tax=Colletotrichum destructivum TaxID=34406 RepID=A0AAX4J1J8_9PEZI|nr:Putative aminotransferase class IV, branched-chain amino acid aminotransferase II [Colletotrichum destructivum]